MAGLNQVRQVAVPLMITLQTDFDGIERAAFYCVFRAVCNEMNERIIALGGSCDTIGSDTTCDLSPLVDED